MSVNGGNGNGIAKTEVVKLVKVGIDLAGGVHFIDCQNDGLSASQQHVGDLLVGGGESRLDVGEEHDDIRMGNGDLRLLAHKGQYLVVRARLDTAGIDEAELSAAPFALAIDAVARNARRVLHDGKTLSDKLIE